MVEISDINDEESLREWLQGQPREVSVWIARRAALRVLPIHWVWVATSDIAKKHDLTGLLILRFNLISEIARIIPISDITAADTAAAWDSVQLDCKAIERGDDLAALPLWADQENPLVETWGTLSAALPVATAGRSDETARGAVVIDWSFWIKWYDDLLAGTPPNWELHKRIALIEGSEWEMGPARVNSLIAGIEQELARAATPYPENLIYDGDYHVVPSSKLRSQTLRDARGRISDVAAAMRCDGNQYSALHDEAELLEDILARYPDRAIRLFEACHKVVGHVSTHVGNGVLPENDNLIGDVVGDLQNSADDIYNFDAEVRETADARAKLRFSRLDDVQRGAIAQIAEAVAQNADAGLAAELREDMAEVATETDPEGDSKPARYRLGSRLVKAVALGGAGLAAVITLLAGVEPAVSGA